MNKTGFFNIKRTNGAKINFLKKAVFKACSVNLPEENNILFAIKNTKIADNKNIIP